MAENKSKKLTWLLLLQGWAMLWVVIGHSPLALSKPRPDIFDLSTLDGFGAAIAYACYKFAYAFHMPLFIMISGYLFYKTRVARNWNFLPMIKEKWLRLGIPYISFIILGILIKFFYHSGRPLDTSFIGIIKNFTHPFDGALQEMWFIAAIFLYFLLYPVYRFVLKNKTYSLILLVGGRNVLYSN